MTKINEDLNLKYYTTYDVSKLKEYVLGITDEWFIDTLKQQRFEVHKHTLSYFVYRHKMGWQPPQPFKSELKVSDQKLVDLIEPMIKDLEKIHDGVRGNVVIIKLMSGKDIGEHIDDGFYLVNTRRHHIPIITSEETTFTVSKDTVNMAEGECWEINNAKLHSVNNSKSKIDRVHLVIDIVPNRILEGS
jgi:hypothetical protein